jgi:hypothetical protein
MMDKQGRMQKNTALCLSAHHQAQKTSFYKGVVLSLTMGGE